MTVLVKQTETRELKGEKPDLKLLIIPDDFREVSEQDRASSVGATPSECMLRS